MRKHAFALLLGMLVVFAFIAWCILPVAKAETTIFNDGFESGDFTAWTGTTGSPTVQGTTKHHGNYSVLLDADETAYKDLGSSYADCYARVYVYFAALPWAQYYGTDVITLVDKDNAEYTLTARAHNVDGTNCKFQLQDAWGASNTTYSVIQLNRWYCLEIYRNVGTGGVIYLDVNGVEEASVAGAWIFDTDRVIIGGALQLSSAFYIDCVVVADGYIGPEDDIPPTFKEISANTTIAGQSCVFTCLVNDETNVSAYIFSTNNTGVWVNDTATVFSNFFNETAARANVTKTLNNTVGNVVSYVWYANDTSNNWSQSDQYNLTTTAIQYNVTFTNSGLDSSASGRVVTVNGTLVNYGQLPYSYWADSDSIITYSYDNVSSTTTGKRFILTGATGQASPMTVTGNAVVTGNYKIRYLLTVTTAPSALTPQPSRNPLGESNPPSDWWYDASVTVTLTAQTVTGYQFQDWTVDSISSGNGVNPTNVIMNSLHAAVANYIQETPISVSIDPMDSTITLGHSVPFTSTAIGGTSPYTHQWYVDGNPVSGATSNTWTYTPAAPGVHYVHLRVTDSSNNTASSPTARVTVSTTPVGGYSIRVSARSTVQPTEAYGVLICLFGAVLAALRRKRRQT